MAQRALNADRPKATLLVEKTRQADDGVRLQKEKRGRGIVQVHLAALDLAHYMLWQRLYIHFQAERQRRARAQARTHPSELCPLDRFVQLQRVAPKGFIAKRIEAE